MSIDKDFSKNGYAIVPRALNDSQVDELRSTLNKIFETKPKQHTLSPHEILKEPKIYNIFFNEQIVDCLKQILGNNYVMLPDFQVQKNMYGYNKGGSGWHTDSNSEGKASYLLDPAYRFVKCAIYLQDNSEDWGGGIDVVEGAHRFPVTTGVQSLDHTIKKVRDRFKQNISSKTLRTQRGDFVVFDSRLPHASTLPKFFDKSRVDHHRLQDIPPENTKYAIFVDASRNDQYVQYFLKNAEKRALLEIKNNTSEVFFSDYVRYRFPESFPQDFVQHVQKHSIQMALVDPERTHHWGKKWKQPNN